MKLPTGIGVSSTMTLYYILVVAATAVGLVLGLGMFAVGCLCWLFGRPLPGGRRKSERRA